MYSDIFFNSYKKAVLNTKTEKCNTKGYVDHAFLAYTFFDDTGYPSLMFRIKEEEFNVLIQQCINFFNENDNNQLLSLSINEILEEYKSFIDRNECDNIMEHIFFYMKTLWQKYKILNPNINEEYIYNLLGVQTNIQKKVNIVDVLKKLLSNDIDYRYMLYSPLPVAKYLGYIK